MRILFVSSSSGSRGGGEFYLVYLAEALKEIGHEVGLWISNDAQMDGIEALFRPIGPVLRHDYVNTFLRKSRSFSHLLPIGSGMNKILNQWKAFNPDFLHLNKQCLEDGLDLLELANAWEIPQGCTIHITQSTVELKARFAYFRDWIARRALKGYRGDLWAIADNRATGLRNYLEGKRTVNCIPNGVRIPDAKEMNELKRKMHEQHAKLLVGEGPVAVSVGRIEEQKDPFRFLEIIQAWKQREPELTAIWVGDGRLRDRFEKTIQEMGATNYIHCVGWQESAHPFLCLADVYVHPARFEGLPFALLEAMAHGLPCVISPELADDLTDIPKDTWIIAGSDEASWIPSLTQDELLNQLGHRSRELATETFSVEAMARKYVEHYRGAISCDNKIPE